MPIATAPPTSFTIPLIATAGCLADALLPAGVCEAEIRPVSGDHMIEDTNTEQLSGFSQAPGDLAIRPARLRTTRGMTMAENDRGRVPGDHLAFVQLPSHRPSTRSTRCGTHAPI